MILLELTEKELEVLKQGLAKEQDSWVDRTDVSNGFRDAVNEVCDSVKAKLDSCAQTRPEVLISAKDLFYLISSAKNEYGHLRADLYISNKRVEENDFKHIALANALIMWLNEKKVLKNLVKFDFTDTSAQYEETEE